MIFWRVMPLRTPCGLLIPLFTIPITRHYNHTQLSITRLRVYTIIITYTLVTKVTDNTLTRLHWLTSQLSITFTNYHRLYIFTFPMSVSYRDLTRRADFQRLTPVSQSQSQSYIATDGQSVSKSWCQAPSGAHDQIFSLLFDRYGLVFMGRPASNNEQ
jgi:hypothetical protein